MAELNEIPRVNRIRCRHCGRRLHADIAICPNCGHDPRSFALPGGLVVILLFGLGTILALLLWYNARLIFLALNQQPTLVAAPPTTSPTWTPRIVVVLATATSTSIPLETPTQTVIPSPTATRTSTATATRIPPPRATSTRTLTPTPTVGPAPVVFAPNEGDKFYGPRRQIVMSWGVTDLPADQWYRLRIEFRDRAEKLFAWCAWTREGQLIFPFVYYDESSPFDRAFRWNVQTMLTNGVPRDSGCDFPGTPVSAPSLTRTFFWY